MPIKQIKTSYNSGELSEYMAAREDINKYHNGASMMINATVLPHGGFIKRSGTEFIGKSPNKCKLFSFEFSVDDSLILEFSNLLIRFYKDGARVLETAIGIDSITNASPPVVTMDGAHSYTSGEWVFIEETTTTTALNNKIFQITVTGGTTFSLQDTEGANVAAAGVESAGSSGTSKRVYQIVSPFTSAQAFEIHTTQSADVMYIAHKDHQPQKLSRLADANWTITDVPFNGGPFLEENTEAADLMGFARTGGIARSEFYFPVGATGTLTATGGHTPFLGTANDVGTLWSVDHTRRDNTTSTFAKDTNVTPTLETFASGAIRIKGDASLEVNTFSNDKAVLWRKAMNGSWQQYKPFSAASSFSWTENEDDVLYALTRSVATVLGTLTAKDQVSRGVVKVTAASSTSVAIVIVIDRVISDNTTDNAVTTPMWAEGAWGLFRGYPRTVSFFEDRLWWASSTNNPDTLWSSRSGLYEDMSFTSLGADNEAITFPINDNEVSQIQWMMPRQVMAVGAANKEYRFGASDPDKPVTPSDRKATPQTSEGSFTIQPRILKDSVFFFLQQGRKLGKMRFDAITENFDVEDSTMLHNTLFESPPTCMAVQRVPDSILWVTREDGVLTSLTYEPKEEVQGWAKHFTDNSVGVETPVGLFESVAVIHGTTEDEVWVSVKRVINSVTVRYTEKFAIRLFDEIDESMMLDSAKVVESAFESQVINNASDTVRYGNGGYGSGLCGGVTS